MSQLDLYLPGILMAHTAFLVGMASPGPNVMAVIGTSMACGRRSGSALAMGIAFGSLLWALLTSFGLTALLASFAPALTLIKVFGGAFLIWLASKSFRNAASKHDLDARAINDAGSVAAYFRRGLLIQMTNPKAALTWIAIFSLGLQEGAPGWVIATIIAGTFSLSVLLHLAYALAFSTAPMVRIYGMARRWIQGVLGLVFTFAGLRLLWSAR